ncbi:hypothetical protein BGZ60DRAFT_479622 [Tricladium varicosporioides]|nr:hypothetical protein BGZ60DRAFT_479622 [Hymenoscyphus varicosporioides]
MSKFRYSSLEPSKNEIRLLLLHPRDSALSALDSPIRCSIFHASLDDNHWYEAMPYRWEGEPTEIMVDDCLLNVSSNLVDALRHMRLDKTRVLWADAICINQKDSVERMF